jgi:hypothetical protein
MAAAVCHIHDTKPRVAIPACATLAFKTAPLGPLNVVTRKFILQSLTARGCESRIVTAIVRRDSASD